MTQIAAFHAFCEMNVVLPMTDGIIVRASEIYAELRTRGRLLPDADILIAATAIENGLVLATNNLSDFSRISGLSCDNWVASN